MRLLGLELSDVGIMVAGSPPARLLAVDEDGVESPGFALPDKKGLTVGRAAEKKAHLFPRQIIDHFWNQLNTDPLEPPNPYVQNHAEIAYEHLAQVWKAVKRHGSEMVIAVPGFFNREDMGMFLGITRELAIPVRGFLTQALVAAPDNLPKGVVFHVDVHLHRFEVSCLECSDRLVFKDSVFIEGSGIRRLYKEWGQVIAEEFVRSTRFDPFHQAVSEQELYNRLPNVLKELQQTPSIEFEMTGGYKTYQVTLTTDSLFQKSESVFQQIGMIIDRMEEKYANKTGTVVLLLTHRAAQLPGLKETLAGKKRWQVIALEQGAAALGALRFWKQSTHQQVGRRVPFLTSRPLPSFSRSRVSPTQTQQEKKERPTHALYRNIAYPISNTPLFVGCERPAEGRGLLMQGQHTGISVKHCAIELRGKDAVLTNYSRHGTMVDESLVTGQAVLQLGQTIRVGSPGETLQLIACRDIDFQ